MSKLLTFSLVFSLLCISIGYENTTAAQDTTTQVQAFLSVVTNGGEAEQAEQSILCPEDLRQLSIQVFNGPPNTTVSFRAFQSTPGIVGFAFTANGPFSEELTVFVSLDANGDGQSNPFFMKALMPGNTIVNACSPQVGCVRNPLDIKVTADIKLERVGKTKIEPRNNYSENTSIRASVICPEGHPRGGEIVKRFNGVITFTEEVETNYYDGNNGATALPQNIQAKRGIANITIKSVSNSEDVAGPVDAKIKATSPMLSQQAATNPLHVDQWVDEDNDGFIDWLEQQAKARRVHFRRIPGIVGKVARVTTGIKQVPVGCGATDVDQTVIGVSPVCGTPNRHRLDTVKELSDTVIHESRHVWQHAQEKARLGGGPPPTNDSDRDHCPEAVPADSEAGAGDTSPIIDGTPPSTGDDTADLPYEDFCKKIFETDARDFGADHRAD